MENRDELGRFFRLEAWVDQEEKSASSHDKETLTGSGAGVAEGGGRGSKGRPEISWCQYGRQSKPLAGVPGSRQEAWKAREGFEADDWVGISSR